MTNAHKKVKEDVKRQKNEIGNMSKDQRIIWRLRGYSELTMYWINAFNFPVALLIWLITGDYWKGLGYLAVSFIYSFAQNLRGLVLHLENFVEWTMNKTI